MQDARVRVCVCLVDLAESRSDENVWIYFANTRYCQIRWWTIGINDIFEVHFPCIFSVLPRNEVDFPSFSHGRASTTALRPILLNYLCGFGKWVQWRTPESFEMNNFLWSFLVVLLSVGQSSSPNWLQFISINVCSGSELTVDNVRLRGHKSCLGSLLERSGTLSVASRAPVQFTRT